MNILITSAGRRAYIIDYFKKVNGIDKVYASNSTYSIALQHADDYLISPLIYSDSYIPAILDFCLNNNINALLSLFDADLLVLAQHKSEFEAHNIRVIISDEKFVRICNDKWLTYKFFIDAGVNTPATYLNRAQLEQGLSHGECSFPIIIKPRWGTGTIGVYVANDINETDVLEKLSYRDIFSSSLKYESNLTPESPIIYQQYISGIEYPLNIINDLKGNYIDTFAIRKIAMRSGETDIGITVSPLPFTDIAESISAQGRHIGILSVDCIKSEEDIYVIELNCRISGTYPILHLSGLRFLQQLADWLNGKSTDMTLLSLNEGITVTKNLDPVILHQQR